LNDWLHVIENDLKPKLLHLEKGSEVLELLVKTFTEKSLVIVEQNLKQATARLQESDQQVVKDFVKNAHRYCTTAMPKKFQSFAITSKFITEVNIRTNQMPIYKNHTGRLFYQYLFV
jgi:hypothetical protein